ncbi:pentatricopeptide repeat-containing protein At4g30825, chloroplastic [Lolium perenne]|uniref:pentatricopeptide repeat-containing protein At4g30825, chloroplastic n=1 Tax=Lolium perenne TaxID=4522 RepID=UPI0021EA9041|nr:pentatricopeptide repeat-containing protein At4g30825, chloroplastic [Lolium perenne]
MGLDLVGFGSRVLPNRVGHAADRRHAGGGAAACHGFFIDTRRRSHLMTTLKDGVVCSPQDGGIAASTLCASGPSETATADSGRDIADAITSAQRSSAGRNKGGRPWRRAPTSGDKPAKHVAPRRAPVRKDTQVRRVLVNDAGVNAILSGVSRESSVEDCNSVLIRLEKHSDVKALDFFVWMRANGKLAGNAGAYHLALQAIAWKEDWRRAELLLHEMVAVSGCRLDARAFNGLIYVCAKRRLVDWGTKWFSMMLERGVQPNASTFGMLMGLYQKTGSLREAEFAFAKMSECGVKCVNAYSAMVTLYTRSGLFARSEEVIALMEDDEVTPNRENWLVRLNAYSQQGKMEEAKFVLQSMVDAGVAPNVVAYNTVITGYGKVFDMEKAKECFDSLEGAGLAPDETTYRSMVEGFGRADKHEEAISYYRKLKRSGFQPNASNFYTMVNLTARHDDNEAAAEILRDMRAAGCQCSSIVTILVRAYGAVEKMHKVLPILQSCFYKKVLSDATSCSILVTSFVQNSLLEEALRVLREKKWKDSDFEDSLYHILICSCKEAGSYEDAVRIYNVMPKSRTQPNLRIACSMIDVFSTMERFADAETLYLELKASACVLDMIAYSVIVRMYNKAGRPEDACSVLEDMEKQADIVPDKYLFLDMLRTYQKCGQFEKLTDTYYSILKSEVEIDEAMYNCIINCCGPAIPVDELSRIFEEMIQLGHLANTVTLNVLLDIYGKAGLFKWAEKVLNMARKHGLADAISYNTIIAAYAQSGDFRSMTYFVQKMQDAGFPVSLEAYNCMLNAYGKSGQLEEFSAVLQRMRRAKCDFDHYTYNIMLNIYGRKGWIEGVACVLSELKSRGVEPDLYSYNTLIKAYGIAGMPEDAVKLMQEMRIKGIDADRVTYSNLIAALQRNENFLEAVKWSLWMKQTGVVGVGTRA